MIFIAVKQYLYPRFIRFIMSKNHDIFNAVSNIFNVSLSHDFPNFSLKQGSFPKMVTTTQNKLQKHFTRE